MKQAISGAMADRKRTMKMEVKNRGKNAAYKSSPNRPEPTRPFMVRLWFVYGSFTLRLRFVYAPFAVRLRFVYAPFAVRLCSVRGPFMVRLSGTSKTHQTLARRF
jgi:hypothetical protein